VGLSRAGRHSQNLRAQELVYRNTRPLAQSVPPPAPRIIQNTVHQTVVHLHQTTHQHILNCLSAVGDGRGNTTLLVRQTALPPPPDGAMDESRPALAARRLLRVLSTVSARQTLRPFYRELLQELLAREREEYRGKPARSLLLVQNILGRSQTLAVLRRFFRETAQRRSMIHSLIYHSYVRRYRQNGERGLLPRYARRELAVPEELRSLYVAKRLPPPRQQPEPEDAPKPREKPQRPIPPAAGALSLSEADFQGLVRGVADALNRQSRLDSLRRGGM